MTKLEEVAEALNDKFCELDMPGETPDWVAIARAAVEALREPTREMVEAARIAYQTNAGISYLPHEMVEDTIYPAMINAILNEKP